MRSADDIATLYQTRLTRLGPLFARMVDVRDTYNGDIVLPLPELSRNEQAAVANLTQQGCDQFGHRIASVLPMLTYPPLPDKARNNVERADQAAAQRRQVTYGWWERSKVKKGIARRARWLLAYGAAPVIVRPDPTLECPVWDPHSPLDVFPSRVHIDCFTPADVIIRHKRDHAWLLAHYPAALAQIRKKHQPSPDDCYDCLEYIDDEEVVWVLLGVSQHDDMYTPSTGAKFAEMTRQPNRAGKCWAVIPQRVTLDRPMGHFDSILGMYKTEAALMALEIIATRKAIWPEPWLVNPNNGAQPHIVQTPDRQTGEPGVVTNGTLIFQQMDPSLRASTVRDQLQYAQRQTAGLPAELGGMSQTNVRTGRRGAQVISAAIDFTIAAAQDIFAESLHDEDIRAIAIDKAYYDTTKQFYVSTKGARGVVDYKPSDLFSTDQHVVEFPISGYDLNDLIIGISQRVASGTLSKRSGMEVDPLVSDVDSEEERIRFEGIEQAFYTALQAAASQPDGPWQFPDLARFAQMMLGDNLPWYEAVDRLQKEKQAEQAKGAPPGAPETMPGLAMPGQGAEVPAIGEQGPSLDNLNQILGQLGRTQGAMAR